MNNFVIYFNDHIADDDLEEFAIHECIHYIQEIKDKRNYLLRMGLCDYTEFKIYGLGLNEAAVQLMASKVLAIPKEYVKYFNIYKKMKSKVISIVFMRDILRDILRDDWN